MSLEEAISHCKEVINSCTNESCKLDHEELFSYLTELKTKRSQIDNTLRFRVNANETIGINEFLEEHRNCCRDYLGKEFFSTTGGNFSYIITPTGLGNIIEVRCNSCGCIKDITDSSDW